MSDRPTRSVLLLISLAVLLYSGAYLAREYTLVHRLVTAVDIWSWLRLGPEPPAEFHDVDEEDFVRPPIPKRGDRLLSFNGLPATSENYFLVFNPETPPGREVTIRFESDGEERTTLVRARPIPLSLRAQIVGLFVLRTLITAALVLVGFWALLRRPDSPGVRILAFFCYSMAIGMLLNRIIGAEDYAAFAIPYGRVLLQIFTGFAFFAPVFWLLLQLVFPAPEPFFHAHRRAVTAVLFLPGLVIGALYLTGVVRLPVPLAVHRSVYLAAGSLLLARHYFRADTLLARRQTKLLIMGSVPGLLLYGVLPWVALLAGDWARGWTVTVRLLTANANFLLVLLIPITFAYAFGRYRLLEVEGRLNRGARLLAVNTALLVVFFGFLYLFSEILLDRLGVVSRAPTLVVALGLAIGFAPAQRRIRREIADRLYPERNRLRALIRDFLRSPDSSADPDTFWRELTRKLAAGIAAREVAPLLEANGGDALILAGEPTPFHRSDPSVREIGALDHPLFVDELIESGRFDLNEEQKRWLGERLGAVLLPLNAPSGRVGFLLLGPKRDGEDYTPEELSLLGSLAAQIGLAAENIRLLEEKVEKRKLEEQLQLARNIQEGLLPGRLPPTPGLHVAASIRFCLDVAGDYYDVIEMEDGRTLLAIGDVAGKGVGAALLMASLQASLRTASGVQTPLPDLIRKVNALVYRNTPPELFISLFTALFDPRTGNFSYVNAGHNYPLVVRKDGGVEGLVRSGLLLGVDPETEYEEGSTTLEPGDRVLMYTDGVNEAMDAGETEFGDLRVARIASESGGLPLRDVLGRLETEVFRHTGRTELEDDFTLLAAERIDGNGEGDAAS
ncbi:MAG: SpoIIE family protein phosphatase [Candidatus Eisenbacteria bacterium]|nr:SpoIIE family protein phosphatase [Candidatus Eisenbacteria bacterium]